MKGRWINKDMFKNCLGFWYKDQEGGNCQIDLLLNLLDVKLSLTVVDISGYFQSQLFSSILYLHRTTQLNDLQKGRMDRKLMFSSVPLRLQLITDAAAFTFVNLVSPVKLIIIQIRKVYGVHRKKKITLEPWVFVFFAFTDNSNFAMSRFFNIEIKWKI